MFPEYLETNQNGEDLYLKYENMIFSNISAMGSVRLPGQSVDYLILCFPDAKVSVVSWNPLKNDIHIISLHYFEKDTGLEVSHLIIIKIKLK